MEASSRNILVRVDNSGQVDGASINGLLQNGSNPDCQYLHRRYQADINILLRMRRVDDDGIFGGIVDNKVGVVVAAADP